MHGNAGGLNEETHKAQQRMIEGLESFDLSPAWWWFQRFPDTRRVSVLPFQFLPVTSEPLL